MSRGMTASIRSSRESWPRTDSIFATSESPGPTWRRTKLSAPGRVRGLVCVVISGSWVVLCGFGAVLWGIQVSECASTELPVGQWHGVIYPFIQPGNTILRENVAAMTDRPGISASAWRMLLSPPLSGPENMACDVALMDRARATGEAVV